MKNLFTLFLAAFLCCTWTNLRADEVTVASDGTDYNTRIPFWGGLASFYQRGQVIYDKADLSDMKGSQINQMTFYLNYSETTTWGDAEFKLSLAEVDATDFGSVDNDAAFNGAELTQVFAGKLSVDGKVLVIMFDDPFVYSGDKNLLFDFLITKTGTGQNIYVLGNNTDAEGAIHGVVGTNYSSSNVTSVSYRERFIPKTTFAYSSVSKCTKPSGLIAFNITPNSAKIGWTTEEVESYTLEYKLSSATDWTTIENAENGLVLDGLTENSTYSVRLQSNCGEEGASSYATTSFSTPCGALSADNLPFEYGFEDVEAGGAIYYIPDCWEKIAYGNYPYVAINSTLATAHEGEKCLYFRGGNQITNCIIIFPTFETPYSELELSFWYKNGATYTFYGQGQIGYVTDKRFASTFVSIQNLERVAEYTHVENVSLAAIPQNAYLAIQFGGGTFDYDGSFYIDDVIISSTEPTCFKPTSLAISDILYNGATVTWEKGSAESSVLQYKRSDAEEWTTINNAVSPYELTGLEASTSYDVRVKNTCGEIGESDYCAIVDFETPCTPFFADSENPFSEGFEGLAKNTIPDCWDNSEMNSPYGYKWGATSYAHTGSSCVRFNSSSANDNGNYNLLKTKSIHIGSTATLSFYYKNPVDATLALYCTIDDGEQTLLDNTFTKQDDWTLYEHALPAACVNHNLKLIFKGISNGEGDPFDIEGLAFISIDDILIECEETCPKPTLDEPVVTNNSVAITWTAGASETEWQYICQPSADLVDWNGSTVKSATSASVELTDLEPATDYTFYLRAKCTEEDFSAVVSKDFRSGCAESIATLNCGFETTEGYKNGELPECWTTLFVTTPAVAPAVTTDAAEYGSQHLRITGSETGQIVVLPKFNQEVKNLQISFKYKRTLGAALYLATLTDPENKATMNVFTSSAFSNGYTYTAVEEYEMTSAREGDHYLAFYYYSSTNATLYIDDIVVEPIPPCKAPTNLYQSEEATVTTVELAWTENGSATEWLIQLSDDNGDTWDAGTKANTNPFQLTGLEPNTSYKARVKAVCGEEESSKWSSEIYFHTEEGTPTALDNANGPSSATKLILNGQLIIKRSDKTYTVTGQEVR